MALEDQINKVDCSGAGVIGTGLAGCRKDRKRVTALGLLTKGFVFAEEITKDYLRELQQNGTLIMLQGVVSFADNTADDNIITREGSGEKVVAGKNPYEYTATFDNGINFHKALTSLSGYNAYDLIVFDVDNTMFGYAPKSGGLKGLTLGMFENGKYTGSNGTDAAAQTVTFQQTVRLEWDLYAGWVSNDDLDFVYSELTGINEVLVTVSPIVTASTSIIVDAYLLDKTHSVDGLLVGDFKVTRNGAVIVPSAVVQNATTKKYTLTVTANTTADIVTVAIKDVVLTTLDVLYKSNTATVVVTAS
jgi:hypothetical protein